MSDDESSRRPEPVTLAGLVDRACDRFEAAWRAGRRPRIEEYLNEAPEPGRAALLRELVMLELEFRRSHGERPTLQEYRVRFPEHATSLDAMLEPTPPHDPVPPAATRGEPDAERDLLFGILAVQMGFLSLEAFARGMQARALDRSKPLGEILTGQGALSGPQQALLETIVKGRLAADGPDPTRSLAESDAAGGMGETRDRAGDDNLHAGPADGTIIGPGTANPRPARAGSVGRSTSYGTRYRIIRPHARGGLGEVYLARDEELRRDVALKELQDRFARNPMSRLRFVQEAEITGGLEHPGIVPVYGLGHHADGRPFYAMRFIRGVSLKEAIERFHGSGPADRDPGERTLELRKLLGRFLDVCNAIAYAHSRGVLHRDLKPGNIMLGQYGETLVVDWGLAKAIDRPESAAIAGEHPLVPSSASGPPTTIPGTAVGTPQFMSPEQAAGRLDLLGPASDVYSLGATLYCLLAGRAPFEGRDVDAVLSAVERGDFPPPRRVAPTVPPALEAICLKAMAMRPANRYASPRDLAEEIERWLADEPVSAYREPWGPRLARWARRHKPWVTGAAALLGTAIVALAVGTVLIEAARRGEAAARSREADQRRLAEAARQAEAEARRQAETQQYFSDVALAGREWVAGNLLRVEDLLNGCPLEPRHWEWYFLKRQGGAGLRTLVGPHVGWVTGLAFSPDGTRLASAGWHGTAEVWDANAGDVVLELEGAAGHTGDILGLAYSPDGRRIATAGKDGTVRLWEAAGGRPGPVLRGHQGPVAAVAFSPDGVRLATAGRDRLVKLWDAATGKESLNLRGHEAPVTAVAFSPDGRLLATAGELPDVAIRLWEAATGKEVHKLKGHTVDVNALAFHPDGRRLASAGNDGVVLIWDVETGEPRSFVAPDERVMVKTVAYSPDGEVLATGGFDQVIRFWKVETRQQLYALRGHTAGVICLAFRPDGRVLASGSEDGVIKLWDATAGPEAVRVAVPEASHAALAFSPDGRWVASAVLPRELNPRGGTVRLWEAAGGRPGPVLEGHDDDISDMAFDPDGRRLAAGGTRGVVTVWELPAGRRLLSLQGPTGKVAARDRPHVAFGPDGRELAYVGVTGSVVVWETAGGRVLRSFRAAGPNRLRLDLGPSVLRFSPDGRRLAVGVIDGTVHLCDVAGGREVAALRGSLAAFRAIAFSPDGRLLATASALQISSTTASEIKVWDLASGRELSTFAGTGGIDELAFSPDGRRLASTGPLQPAKLWDIQSGRELLNLPIDIRTGLGERAAGAYSRIAFSPDGAQLALVGFGGVMIWDATTGPEVMTMHASFAPQGLAYSPDGRRLAIADGEDAVRVRDAATGRVQLTLPVPDWSTGLALSDVRFSPDGRRLAATFGNASSGSVALWDAATGRLEARLDGHASFAFNVAFSPDGRRIATASHDKTARVWDAATGRALWTLGAHGDMVNAVAFSPDGARLVTGGRDKTVRLWDAATGRELRTLRGHKGNVVAVAFSPDDTRLVSVGGRGTSSPSGPSFGEVKLWDPATGREALSVPDYPRSLFSVAFSPDGRSFAAAGEERVVRVWETATGREQLALRGHQNTIMRVAFRPAGRFLASCGHDWTARVWDLTPPPPPFGPAPPAPDRRNPGPVRDATR